MSAPDDSTASPFANPAGDASAGAAEYVRASLELLGDRDPWAVQRELVPELRRLTASLTRDQLTRPEKPGKWSILEVVRHLADTEIVYGYRTRLILAAGADGDEPEIPGYDQDQWATHLHYDEADLEATLVELEAARAGSLRLLSGLEEDAWDRAGRHAERGRESVRGIFRLLAAHDLIHRNQIRRIREAHGLD